MSWENLKAKDHSVGRTNRDESNQTSYLPEADRLHPQECIVRRKIS